MERYPPLLAVRVKPGVIDKLKELARADDRSLPSYLGRVLDALVETERRQFGGTGFERRVQ
jgi:hypothetical protein